MKTENNKKQENRFSNIPTKSPKRGKCEFCDKDGYEVYGHKRCAYHRLQIYTELILKANSRRLAALGIIVAGIVIYSLV